MRAGRTAGGATAISRRGRTWPRSLSHSAVLLPSKDKPDDPAHDADNPDPAYAEGRVDRDPLPKEVEQTAGGCQGSNNEHGPPGFQYLHRCSYRPLMAVWYSRNSSKNRWANSCVAGSPGRQPDDSGVFSEVASLSDRFSRLQCAPGSFKGASCGGIRRIAVINILPT